jgi:hypothetical protein
LGNTDAAAAVEAVLPAAVENLIRTRRAAGQPEVPPRLVVELHIPFVGRRSPVLGQFAEPIADAAGRIVLGNPGQGFALSLLTGPLRRQPDQSAGTLVFSDTRLLRGFDAAPILASLIENHGHTAPKFPASDDLWETTWLMQLDASAASAWLRLPAPGGAPFYQQMKQATFAAQWAIRTGAAYLYFLEFEHLTDREHASPMLVYSSMRPVHGRSKYQFHYDVLEPEPIRRSLRWATRPLGRALRRILQRIAARGREELAPFYPIGSRIRLVRAMRRLPRLFGFLLAGEARILRILIRLGEWGCDLASRSGENGSPLFVQRQAQEFQELFEQRMRRFYFGEDYTCLLPLVLLAATAGLAAGQGLDGRVLMQIRMRNQRTGERFDWSNPHSYANSRRRPALSKV